jgi:pimeloyl-ACP methyl ester carboxylesterase
MSFMSKCFIVVPLALCLCAGTLAAEPDVVASSTASDACFATGEACSLGIDPDVYGMPLPGEYIQSGEERICATRSWSTLPAEAFDLDFMRAFWLSMSSEQRASAEVSAYVFVTTHWGPPAAAAGDLSEVATPSAFGGEVFSSLERRTTRVELEVPKTDFERLGWRASVAPVAVAADPAPDVPVKLRGWYIKGDGVRPAASCQGARASLEHPLVILSSGFPYTIAHDELVGGIAVARQTRRTVTYLVAQGYDVLYFDKRGHGYSEGLVDGMGRDVFWALDQLEKGVIIEDGQRLTLSLITPDGRRLRGLAAAREQLLGAGYRAKTKPVVLRGFSYGSTQLQKAMALNYSDEPVEYRFTRDTAGDLVVDADRMPAGNRGYAFEGIVAISGFQGSVKYETVPYFLALDAGATTSGHSGASAKSGVFASMDRWPGYLGLFATNDFETADGAVDAYNQKLRGFKELALVTGYHFGLASEQVDSYFAELTAEFARRVVFDAPPQANTATTTYAREVCSAERVLMDPATQAITSVPSAVIRAANRRVEHVLRDWVRRERATP